MRTLFYTPHRLATKTTAQKTRQLIILSKPYGSNSRAALRNPVRITLLLLLYVTQSLHILFSFCDLDGSRTHTPLRAQDPQSCLSTSSSTRPCISFVPSVGVEPTQDFRLTSSEPVASQPVAPRRYLTIHTCITYYKQV